MSEHTPAVRRDPIALGNVLARSGFFTDSKSEAQAAVKVMAGEELGIGPVAAMTGIHIVKGKVTLSANLIAGQIKRSCRYDYRVTRLDGTGCIIEFFQDGERIGTSAFTDADAKAAGLWGQQGPWKAHPKNMLFARAMSNGAKWYCPDVFAGPVYTPDELGAVVDGETGEVLSLPTDTADLIKSRVAELRGGMTNEFLGRVMQDAGITSAELVDDEVYERAKEAMRAAVDARADDAIARHNHETPPADAPKLTPAQMKGLHAKAKEHGLDHAALHQIAADLFSVESLKEVPSDGMDAILEAIAAHEVAA